MTGRRLARWRAAACADERGASAVEFAMIVPVFFALVLGMFSGGQAYDQSLTVTHAVREGARFGAAYPLNQEGNNNGSGWVAKIKAVTEERANGNLNVAGSVICVAVVQGASAVYNPAGTNPYTTKSDGTSCYNDGGADSAARVQVLASRPAFIDVMFVRMSITVNSRSVAKIEAQPG